MVSSSSLKEKTQVEDLIWVGLSLKNPGTQQVFTFVTLELHCAKSPSIMGYDNHCDLLAENLSNTKIQISWRYGQSLNAGVADNIKLCSNPVCEMKCI